MRRLSRDERKHTGGNRFTRQTGDLVVVNIPRGRQKRLDAQFTLSNEKGDLRDNPSAKALIRVIRRIDSGNGNSFCCLEAADHSYLQALRGVNGWHLEWRECAVGEKGRWQQYRAGSHHGSRRRRLLRKDDGATSRGLECELLERDTVEQCFLAFLHSQPRPSTLRWRALSLEKL